MTLFFLLFLPTNIGQLYRTQIDRPEKRHPESHTHTKKYFKTKTNQKKPKQKIVKRYHVDGIKSE